MANVVLVCTYDQWALGLRCIANALRAEGHRACIIYMKRTAREYLPDYQETPTNYEIVYSWQVQDSFRVVAHNYDVNKWTDGEVGLLSHLIQRLNPDIVGVSTRSVDVNYFRELLPAFKPNPGVITVAGGFGVTFSPEYYIDAFDYLCRGEGEDAMLGIARAVDRGDDPGQAPNLLYLRDGKEVATPLACPDDSADYFHNHATASVDCYLIESERIYRLDIYLQSLYLQSGKELPVEYCYYTTNSRGCARNCSFCCGGRLYNKFYSEFRGLKKLRHRPIGKVLEELKYIRTYGFRAVNFMDSYFTGEPEYLREFFAAYRKHVNMPFFAQLYPEQVLRHPDILDRAIEAGLYKTVVGVQTGSEDIRRDVFHRPSPDRNIMEFSRMLSRRKELLFEYHLITHNPFDTDESVAKTLDLLGKFPKNNAYLATIRLRPFLGTELAEMIAKLPPATPEDNVLHKRRLLLYLLRWAMPDKQWVAFEPTAGGMDNERLVQALLQAKRDNPNPIEDGQVELAYPRRAA